MSLEVVYYTQNLPKKQSHICHVAELALPADTIITGFGLMNKGLIPERSKAA